jgi:acetyltransferase-like isoleucine patch superfamily enzyme
MVSMIKLIREFTEKVRNSVELRKYNSFTIAEYFRKQGAQIGEGCNIIPTFLGTEPYLIKIGNHVTIANGVVFVTHDGGAWIARDEYPNVQVFGPIIIEDNCVIGQNAILFPNIRIGKNSIVGAGSVVISNVPPNTIAMGVPARPFGAVDKYKKKCIERWQIQKPYDFIIEPSRTWWNSKHYYENRKKLKDHLLKVFSRELGLNDSNGNAQSE